MRLLRFIGRFGTLATVLIAASAPSIATASDSLPWQTGMRAVGNGATIEPAVSLTDGSQTFLITPNNSPFYQGSPSAPTPPAPFNKVSAPLYLVTYPIGSTADAQAPLNCYTEGFFVSGLPCNCDHAQIPGIKGHDHLVGVPGSQKAGGDYNVQWHVWVTFFTPQGVADGAMNTRILTLDQLTAAQAKGDVTPFIDTYIYFDCSAVSGAVYQNSAPLNFSTRQTKGSPRPAGVGRGHPHMLIDRTGGSSRERQHMTTIRAQHA